MELINGRKIAKQIYETFPARLQRLGFVPVLADIIVGSDPVAMSYVNIKNRTAKAQGLDFHTEHMTAGSTLEQIHDSIRHIQKDSKISGLIVQLPLPNRIDQNSALDIIDPDIDVDCIGPKMNQLFYNNNAPWLPPTAGAIWEILQTLPEDFRQKKIGVVGQGELVGKPITHLLLQAECNVVTATQLDTDLKSIIESCDIVISGTGKGGLVTGDMIKEGVIIIDAGTSESGSGIVGDVDKDSVSHKASLLSPVPGGVGPVTVAKLLDNVISAAERRFQKA